MCQERVVTGAPGRARKRGRGLGDDVAGLALGGGGPGGVGRGHGRWCGGQRGRQGQCGEGGEHGGAGAHTALPTVRWCCGAVWGTVETCGLSVADRSAQIRWPHVSGHVSGHVATGASLPRASPPRVRASSTPASSGRTAYVSRYAPGVIPVQRRNARWNAAASEKPSRTASSSIGSPVSRRPPIAASRRTWSLSRWKEVSSSSSRRRSVAGLTASRAATSPQLRQPSGEADARPATGRRPTGARPDRPGPPAAAPRRARGAPAGRRSCRTRGGRAVRRARGATAPGGTPRPGSRARTASGDRIRPPCGPRRSAGRSRTVARTRRACGGAGWANWVHSSGIRRPISQPASRCQMSISHSATIWLSWRVRNCPWRPNTASLALAALQRQVGPAGEEPVEARAALQGGAEVGAAERGVAHHGERAGPTARRAEPQELVPRGPVQGAHQPGELLGGEARAVVAEQQRRYPGPLEQRGGVDAEPLRAAHRGPYVVHRDRSPPPTLGPPHGRNGNPIECAMSTVRRDSIT